ncbi:hypothetical protein FLA_1007 [Filimonas lacunae]|nr:hypothetical protein FLA_1007 [Filimonas lacunae]
MVVLPLVMAGCTKKELLKFDEAKLGSSIYFSDNYAKAAVTVNVISFGYLAANVTDSIISFPIYVTGSPSDSDRTYAVQFADTSTMTEGIDFDFYRAPVVRAGRVQDTLMLILHRTAQLKDTTLHVDIKLVSNASFNTAIPYYYSGSDSVSLLQCRITCNDIAGVSYLWTGSYKSTVVGYMGAYSLTKVQLMMAVLGLSSAVFYDSGSTPSIGLFSGWAAYMKNWLANEKLAGRIYYDENGNEITMGVYA